MLDLVGCRSRQESGYGEIRGRKENAKGIPGKKEAGKRPGFCVGRLLRSPSSQAGFILKRTDEYTVVFVPVSFTCSFK